MCRIILFGQADTVEVARELCRPMVVMFGGLHIEMAALKRLGDWLQGRSGWVQALVQAEIATAATADSFLRASHVLRTRRAHQVTAAALYILQHHAYNHYCLGETRDAEDLPEFEDWCCHPLC